MIVTASTRANQPVSLEVSYELPNQSYLCAGEILLSPFIVVGNMSEDETELQLKLPFLRELPEDSASMTKWIRFFGAPSDDGVPMWKDIRSAEELDAFMVEIREDYAKLYTQQNVTFCIVGSRDEPTVLYDYGAGETTDLKTRLDGVAGVN